MDIILRIQVRTQIKLLRISDFSLCTWVIESQLCTAAVQNYAGAHAHVCVSAERYQLDTNVEILQRMPRKIGKITNYTLRVS